MIIDNISQISKYQVLSERLAKAAHFLESIKLKTPDNGEHEIEGKDLFCIVMENITTVMSEPKLEAHKKYIDIHYILSGSEIIGYAGKAEQKVLKAYDFENDYALYEGNMTMIKMYPQMFAIFFPEDLHMPGISNGQEKVRKIVMKVKI